jgi:hypothetical protein
LIYDDLDMIDVRRRTLVISGGTVGGGDAVTIDSMGRAADLVCLSCGEHWGSAWGALDKSLVKEMVWQTISSSTY